MVIHGAKALVVAVAAEATNTQSGTSSAVVVAVIGVAGLLLQMVVKDYLDGRKARRRHQEHIDAKDIVEELRKENARLTRQCHQLRRELEEARHAPQ